MSSRLECRNLTKDYGNVMALSDVNLTLESGRIVGLLGPNGSGKTTLIKTANGLLQPTSGEILLNGLKPGPETKIICFLSAGCELFTGLDEHRRTGWNVCRFLRRLRPEKSRRNA